MSDREHLADVYEAYRADPRFDHLRTQGIVLVPGMGVSRPKIFVCGEAPGATENTLRAPFKGVSGRALRSLMKDVAELDQDDLFITNVVKYRPPGNRTPTDEEIEASVPYLRREYAALGSPPVLIAVGRPAREALAPDIKGGQLSVGGKMFKRPQGKALWVMVHPRYALSNPAYRLTMEKHWEDFGNWYREEFG